MTKRKSRKEQTTQWPKEKVENSTFSFGHCVVCSFLLFLLVIVLSVLFYFFFWSLCCLFFSTFSFGHGQKKK
jgi:hypothetical protein